MRCTELTLRSPRLWKRGQLHLAYSNQVAEGRGAITGGLSPIFRFPIPATLSSIMRPARNTLDVGFDANLPWQVFASTNMYYGSGFSNGSPGDPFPGDHLPPTPRNLRPFARKIASGRNTYTVSLSALNVANRHLLIDNSLTFGGFHYDDPREIYVEFRYKFHY